MVDVIVHTRAFQHASIHVRVPFCHSVDVRERGNCQAWLNLREWTLFGASLNSFSSHSWTSKVSRNLTDPFDDVKYNEGRL